MTQNERINQMSVEEKAKLLNEFPNCKHCYYGLNGLSCPPLSFNKACIFGTIKFLNSEVENNG